jgi:hypothetical protein
MGDFQGIKRRESRSAQMKHVHGRRRLVAELAN